METTIEILAGEGGADARLLVKMLAGVYRKAAALESL